MDVGQLPHLSRRGLGVGLPGDEDDERHHDRRRQRLIHVVLLLPQLGIRRPREVDPIGHRGRHDFAGELSALQHEPDQELMGPAPSVVGWNSRGDVAGKAAILKDGIGQGRAGLVAYPGGDGAVRCDQQAHRYRALPGPQCPGPFTDQLRTRG